MSELRVYHESGGTQPLEVLTGFESILRRLNAVGIDFARWTTESRLEADATGDEIIAAYRESVDGLSARYGFQSIDVISMHPEHPDKGSMRQKFLCEHTHDEYEARFFVDGAALFYLHVRNHVYGMLCTRGDFISVPAGMAHWFDMGPHPRFRAIRMFTRPDGWVARLTGDSIADRFPRMEAPYYPSARAA